MCLSILFVWLTFVNNCLILQAAYHPESNGTNTLLATEKDTRTKLMLKKLLEDYDKRLRPNFGGQPCKVNISMHVLSMVPIKEIDMEVTVVLFFRQHWVDPRLAYGHSLGIPKLKLLGNIVDQVWLPDTFFVNDLSDKTTCGDFLFELTEEGAITHSCRMKLLLYCPMNLRKFPMDEQVCEMAFESFSYTTEDVILSWLTGDKESIRVSSELQIPQYTLVDVELTAKTQVYITGDFSSMSIKFHLQREIGYYLLQEFTPTILIVALSWVGFWIDERSVPARVALGITTVLAITTLMYGVQSSLPRVGHVKAIDVFLLGSFLFVFAALLEFAVICSFTNVFSSKRGRNSSVSPSVVVEEMDDVEKNCKENGVLQQDAKQEKIPEKDNQDENYSPSFSFATTSPWRANTLKLPNKALRPFPPQREPCIIDKHCRKLFPLGYLLYLSIYFAVYHFVQV